MFAILNFFCAVSFFAFGLSCFTAAYMRREFARYGLARFRVMTGVLQLLGALGVSIGLWHALIGMAAALGLSLLMLAGFVTRLRIRDSALQCLPSFAYMLLCAWLSLEYRALF